MDQYRKEESNDIDPIIVLPAEYYNLVEAFLVKEANRLPERRGGIDDYSINITQELDQILRLYRMLREEINEVYRQVNENLSKGFIEAS